jgi:TIR domain
VPSGRLVEMSQSPDQELYEAVLTLKNCVKAISTAGPYEGPDYEMLRSVLIENDFVGSRLPIGIRTNRSRAELWPFIKSKFSTYQERRQYWEDQFAGLLDELEAKSVASSGSRKITLSDISPESEQYRAPSLFEIFFPTNRNAENKPIEKPGIAEKKENMTTFSKTIFICYSRKDATYKDELLEHLSTSKGRIDVWCDEDVRPGEEWFAKIEGALEKAAIAVLLVSPSFFASEFIMDHELPPILKRHRELSLQILWIPIRSCVFEETEIGPLQAASDPAHPMAEMGIERDRAWTKICKLILETARRNHKK